MMTYSEKIRRLYNITENDNSGYAESELTALEKHLQIHLPEKLRSYYLTLGKNQNINYTHNRLLKPDKEVGFSDDRHLVFYEENQVVAFWGIKEEDLKLENPPVWGNYGTNEIPDWHVETKTIEDFLLLMAVYNGTLGGLKFNANTLEQLNSEPITFIEKNWELVPEISWERQKVYTKDFYEVISLSFNEVKNCTGAFIGTSDQQRFDHLLDRLNIEWSYTSYEDEEEDL